MLRNESQQVPFHYFLCSLKIFDAISVSIPIVHQSFQCSAFMRTVRNAGYKHCDLKSCVLNAGSLPNRQICDEFTSNVGVTTFGKTKRFDSRFSSFGDFVQSAQSDTIWNQSMDMYNINSTVELSGYQGPQINFYFTAFHYAFWASIPFQRGHPQ